MKTYFRKVRDKIKAAAERRLLEATYPKCALCGCTLGVRRVNAGVEYCEAHAPGLLSLEEKRLGLNYITPAHDAAIQKFFRENP